MSFVKFIDYSNLFRDKTLLQQMQKFIVYILVIYVSICLTILGFYILVISLSVHFLHKYIMFSLICYD